MWFIIRADHLGTNNCVVLYINDLVWPFQSYCTEYYLDPSSGETDDRSTIINDKSLQYSFVLLNEWFEYSIENEISLH